MSIQKGVDGVAEVFMRRYAAGKCFAFAAGDPRYAKEAEVAMRRSISLHTVFSPEQFLGEMRKTGVPDDISAAYIRTASTTDETYYKDTDGTYFKDVDP